MAGPVRITVVDGSERARYDDAVAASPRADIMQSWAWGRVKSTSGWDALRLLAVDADGQTRGACQVLRVRPLRGAPPLLYAPRGPVVDPADTEALQAMLEHIRRAAGSAFLFKCDPPVEADTVDAHSLEAAGLRRVEGGAFGGTQPTAVMVLDISKGADDVFAGFKSKWRYNVRLAERKGVVARDGTRDDLDRFHELYLETAARDGFVGRARPYFDTLFDELGDQCRLYVAEHDGDMLAGILNLSMGSRVVYTYGASANHKRNLMPNHLLQWHAIKDACTQGFTTYDFRGVSPERDGQPVQEHLAGLNRFKAGFGARYVEYIGELDLTSLAVWYTAWRAGLPTAMNVRRALLKRGSR